MEWCDKERRWDDMRESLLEEIKAVRVAREVAIRDLREREVELEGLRREKEKYLKEMGKRGRTSS